VNNLSLARGAVTSDKIADGTLTSADLSPTLASNTCWRLGGNAGTVPGPQCLGTTDNRPVESQDFHAAFGVGTDDKHIATVDAEDVALAAIQGLNEVVKD
jgi:hypothetical protein